MGSRLRTDTDMNPLGLYLHIPFCSRRCDYCDFFVVLGMEDQFQLYVDKLSEDVRAAGAGLAARQLDADTLYIGGGTPSRLQPGQVSQLVKSCRDAFGLGSEAEITLEANPEGIDGKTLEGWLEAGINRLSVGIQSLNDTGLRNRGRLHTGDEALRALGEARAAGFVNINADLIAGLPRARNRQGFNGFAGEILEDLGRVIGLQPDHVSLYLLETDKDVPLMKAAREGRETLPSDDEIADAYESALDLMAGAGYEQYEISSFARGRRKSRHNLKYWRSEPVLGFGPSAHSFFDNRRSSVPRNLDAYMAEPSAEPAPNSGPYEFDGGENRLDHTLGSRIQQVREALTLQLRLIEGVDLDAFDARWKAGTAGWLESDIQEVREAGLVEASQGRLKLTRAGLLLANEVFQRIR
jgi:oxygen-independent coproporphyrinogen-3 oxidase